MTIDRHCYYQRRLSGALAALGTYTAPPTDTEALYRLMQIATFWQVCTDDLYRAATGRD